MALDGLARGLVALGHTVTVRPLRTRTPSHTLTRWLYNRQVAARPPTADIVVGVDLDGYQWARRRGVMAPDVRHEGAWGPVRGPDVQSKKDIAERVLYERPRVPRYVVALKGIIADELKNERGIVRALLGIQARWERMNVSAAERVVVPSRYSATIAQALYGVAASRLVVVPEPIDLEEWRRRFDEVPAPAASRPPTVLCVARLYPRKRVADLLHAAVHLRARIPEVRIRIVGGGPQSAPLRGLHGELGLGDTVTFLGDVSRRVLAVEYVGAHCFCLPTVQEGFGLVFTEAMAAGLPVVACRAAAVPEVVDDRRTGLLVNPRAPEELAMAMETLLRNPGLRAQMGDAGRRRVDAFGLRPVAARFAAAVGA
ncbi:MAG TPA: glycosyltransferase family 4 protein [Candidatus Limnocylindria bacterium]|nr:glycosyltransferase family 4 protein [Candidatus Limnocylindria bacterium]